MSDLALTPTRRLRLEQVGRGEIYRDEVGVWHQTSGRRITAEVVMFERAGWVQEEPHPVLPTRTLYALTAAGVEVLAARPVDDIPEGSVWRDNVNPGRRLKVTHVSVYRVEFQVTYSPAADAFTLSDRSDVLPRREWTTNRFAPEATADGAS